MKGSMHFKIGLLKVFKVACKKNLVFVELYCKFVTAVIISDRAFVTVSQFQHSLIFVVKATNPPLEWGVSRLSFGKAPALLVNNDAPVK